METIDYSKFFHPAHFDEPGVAGTEPDERIYEGHDGVQFRSRSGRKIVHDRVLISDHAFLFATEYSYQQEDWQRQIVSEGDWVHVQFRLNGGGYEYISNQDVVETPEKSCIVSRYPINSIIERKVDETNGFKVACLFLSPRALTRMLDVQPSRLPKNLSWLGMEEPQDHHNRVVPLHPAMIMAVNDILSCPFRGMTRRAYMRAKSLELLTTVVHAVDTARSPDSSAIKLSSSDRQKISYVQTIMTKNIEGSLTLAELARKVGLNRTKLALGFREVYGTSVQSYWRDVKLSHAREVLRTGEAQVTEVALSLGYSELSSFTRAFSRKFGLLPRDCKGGFA